MFSRRGFLCVASSSSLALAANPRAEDKPEVKKPEPLLSAAARKAIDAGLKYLKDAQHKDGSFGTLARGNIGITSLCGLAMLSGGHQAGLGAFGGSLDQALDFVMGKEDVGGVRPGFLHNPTASPHGPMYNHGLGVMFLAAADGKISDPKRAKKVREVLGRAVALTLKSQNAEKGWRYQPTSQDSDVTVTAGQVFGLRMARDAGIGVPKAALDGAARYLKKCQDANGGFRYMARGGMPNWSRTAAALLGLYCAGVTRGPEIERGLAFLLKNHPDLKPARPDMHYFFGHYHAALATWAAGGEYRRKWYEPARDELIARQRPGGNWLDQICTHYGTAAALIALQAPNGFLSPEF
jgi:hypothetical protein